jgi:predicted nucleic acid-binding protein
MRVFLDTRVIVRYLTDDPPAMATVAAGLIEGLNGDETLSISPLILAEVAHVLQSVYKWTPPAVVAALIELVEQENIDTFYLDKPLVVRAVERCGISSAVTVPDALLWAETTQEQAAVYTFDRRFRSEGIEVRRLRPSR